MRIAYLDCFSGVSGDMLLGALLDAGLPQSSLREALAKLPLPADCLTVEKKMVQAFAATKVHVRGEEKHLNNDARHGDGKHHHGSHHGHDHDHQDHGEHVHAHNHECHHGRHDHGHAHAQKHHENHHHDHEHQQRHDQNHGFHKHDDDKRAHDHDHEHNHAHAHRNLADIAEILATAQLDPAVHGRALAVFTRLAEAEALAHGTSPEKIHFHEVGAIDALVDIVGVVAGLHLLGVEQLICSPLPMPSGWVRCAHGEIPLPAPAVCRLLQGVPVYGVALAQELVTPTGAALVRELSTSFGPMPSMLMECTGYGAGSHQRRDGRPNLLRLILGQTLTLHEAQQVAVLETHLDDWNPEFWPLCSERLMAAGALDVCLIPVQMKKGRPGFLLRVLSDLSHRQEISSLIFTETGTAGLRIRYEDRLTLPREIVSITTPWGTVTAKKISAPDGPRIVPEYAACRELAEKHGISLQRIYEEARRHAGDF